MSRHAPRISGLLGVVHRVADEWRILVVDTAGGSPRVRGTETVPAASPASVRSFLESARVEHVLQVVPASASVCRTCTLPDAEGEALDAALRLQAETWLLAGTPEHRYGGGVLPKAAAETSRTGIVASWPETARVDEAPSPVDSHWVPEPVALAALLHDQRPAEPLLSVDRARGSVAMALCDPGGASIRSTHVDLETDWRPVLERVIVETALGGDHTPAFARRAAADVVGSLGNLGAREAGCVLPPAIIESARRRLADAGGDDQWWNTFGVAAGAALAAVGPFADAAHLERDAIIEEETLLSRLADAVARPRTAAIVAGVCVLLLAVLPLLTSGLRRAVLQARHGDVATLADQVTQATARLAMYDALEDRSWSMTKLLGDIASNTPEGITLTNLTVSLDQQTFSARGEALGRAGDEAPQRLLLMQQQLGETDGLFSSVSIDWDRENNFGAYNITISADIAQPFVRPEYPVERDFGKWTAWMRQQNMPPPDPDADDAGDGAGDGGDGNGGDGDVPPDAIASAGDGDDQGAGRVRDLGSAPSRPRIDTTPRSSGGSAARDAERGGVEPGDTPTIGAIPRASTDRPGTTRTDRDPRERIGSSGTALEGGSVEARTGSAAGGGDIPEPLTAAQIATFDRPQVLDYMRRVSTARTRFRGVEGQEALEERLGNEFDMLKDRLREISDSGGGR
jgi:hypothetical protein